jgi:guanylate kinase
MTKEEFLEQLPELKTNYRSAPEVLEHIGGVKLLMLIGPTGVGKSTLINNLGLAFVPSDTSRPARPGEKDGIDFNFHSDYSALTADITAGRFVQVAIGPSGDFYATKASSYPKSGFAVMPVVADVVPIFRQLGFKETFSAFITPPSYEEWMSRIKKHGLTDQEIKKRLPEAIRSLNFALTDATTHFILNDNLDKAAAQIQKLLDNKIDKNRESEAHKAAQEILDHLK